MGPSTPSDRPTTSGPAPARVRWAHLADLGAVVRLYRGQSEESRRNFHPYPFDRPRLIPIFLGMLVSSALVRTMLRIAPNYAFVVLLAEPRPGAPPYALGTIRFVREGTTPVWARFGYLVEEGHRGEGIGLRLAIAQWRVAVELGVHRGGGTILEGNLASSRVVEPFGFRLEPSSEADRRAAGRRNLGAVRDLDEVLAEAQRQGGTRADALVAEIGR